jgi:hypothetical protein
MRTEDLCGSKQKADVGDEQPLMPEPDTFRYAGRRRENQSLRYLPESSCWL